LPGFPFSAAFRGPLQEVSSSILRFGRPSMEPPLSGVPVEDLMGSDVSVSFQISLERYDLSSALRGDYLTWK
jgi:hypothetical protein